MLLVKWGTTPLLIPAHQHLLQLPGTNFQHPIWEPTQSGSSNFVRRLPTADCHLMLPRSSEHHGGSAYSLHTTHPVQQWLDFCNRLQLNLHQPTVYKSSSWFLACIVWIRTEPQCYWDYIPKCNKCNSRDPARSFPLVSFLIYERNLSPETSATKVHQDMGCQQNVVLSEKSRTTCKWLTHVQATDILKTAALLTILCGWKIYTYTPPYVQCHLYGPVPR